MLTKAHLFSFFKSSTLLARGSRLVALVSFAAAIDPVVSQISPTIQLVRLVRHSAFETILSALVVFLLSELFFFQRRLPDTDEHSKKSESEVFSAAIVQFARHLQDTGKHGPLLLLRDNLSHVLHLLRAHSERIELGRLALAAAVEAKSDNHRALILIDDLGWAFAEMNDVAQAKRNINKGIETTRHARSADPLEQARLCLTRAKGLRHLAMLSTSSHEAMDYLKQATSELEALKADTSIASRIGVDVARDEAQLKHAGASVLAKELGLDAASARPIADPAILQSAAAAIRSAEEAATIFEVIRDDERHAKALMLVEKIQKRIGLDVDAIETNARIRRVLRAPQD